MPQPYNNLPPHELSGEQQLALDHLELLRQHIAIANGAIQGAELQSVERLMPPAERETLNMALHDRVMKPLNATCEQVQGWIREGTEVVKVRDIERRDDPSHGGIAAGTGHASGLATPHGRVVIFKMPVPEDNPYSRTVELRWEPLERIKFGNYYCNEAVITSSLDKKGWLDLKVALNDLDEHGQYRVPSQYIGVDIADNTSSRATIIYASALRNQPFQPDYLSELLSFGSLIQSLPYGMPQARRSALQQLLGRLTHKQS